MARFRELNVTGVRKTTRDAVVVTLAPADGVTEFKQGQYLTFRREFGGEEVRRSYSICTGRTEGIIQVGIKRVEGGVFSSWANENLETGMTLEAMGPAGSFHAPIDPARAAHYLGFAGGSGITPVLSIIKTVLAEEPLSRFTLTYGNRTMGSIMFREELEDLKNLHMRRLNIIHVLESEAQDIELFSGRIDEAKCRSLFERWIDIEGTDTAFICGPEPMMLAVATSLAARGLPEERIKYELFTTSEPGRALRPAPAAASIEVSAGLTRATVTLDGASRSFEMERRVTLLDAALDNAIDAPFACRAGVCSTCRCRVLDGEVEMSSNHALEDHEVAQGYVLACQSIPITDRVVVDFDH